MDYQRQVELLKKEAQERPASNAVLHVFALRKRARHNVNLISLVQRMKREGFSYRKDEYVPLLKLMATLGYGDLQTNYKGRVIGLKNVRIKLQSIGQAACGGKADFTLHHRARRFKEIPQPKVEAPIAPPVQNPVQPPVQKPIERPRLNTINLELEINHKTIHIPLPNNLSAEELTVFIDHLKGKAS